MTGGMQLSLFGKSWSDRSFIYMFFESKLPKAAEIVAAGNIWTHRRSVLAPEQGFVSKLLRPRAIQQLADGAVVARQQRLLFELILILG